MKKFLYILLRFRKWQFSLGAVAAVFHDVLIVLSIFSIFSHFLNFGWFCDGFILNFGSPAKFPARGWSQIARALNFHLK